MAAEDEDANAGDDGGERGFNTPSGEERGILALQEPILSNPAAATGVDNNGGDSSTGAAHD
eukprot:CAMPEP_0197584656 /NCGR_PEP_ID=MMETSP1326-20131121/7206_1 /TAXON_ID=1155430 /ORGANISM="Genus nov. species nov., Strain RCC2288" /LENGTH=60 /DNA_ID=CAMNT_0043149057 /DNA_START=98 /DNA_END=278 /DNA_ORIENTATION=+